MTSPRRIVFVTTPNTDPWSGAEELWARAALNLLSRGFPVSASVTDFSPLHRRLLDLEQRGVELWLRPIWYSWSQHPWRRVASRRRGPAIHEIKRLLAPRNAALVIFSEGNALPPIEPLELCATKGIPFVTLSQANKEAVWYTDDLAERYRIVLAAARRCFFVSDGNRRLCEKQISGALDNAEVVRNPVNVSYEASPTWPPWSNNAGLRFACVGRLYPPAKGQDILFEALAQPQWAQRRWSLHLYGDGEMRQGLEALAARHGLSARVTFPGFSSVFDIWAANHVLVMPSRYEGLPLAMVEAMLCARPVIATDIAGHAEVIEDGVTGFLADAPTAGSIGAALERFWERRGEAEEMGKAGARRIRELVPPDPARVFSEKLQKLAASAVSG
jgi:glycosyltransferase involved in cell wall biosynthesis